MADYLTWGAQELNKLSKPSRQKPQVRLAPGMLLEDQASGWVGVAVSCQKISGVEVVGLEDAAGRVKSFPLGDGFLFEGQAVKVLAPARTPSQRKPKISPSGSRQVENLTARVARASRLWVEGIHDAELIEKVWGHDLRVEGIVVEPLHGVDDLVSAITAFNPGPQRRLGIIVDHLLQGSKESKIADQAQQLPGYRGNVLLVGHPYVDIWQAVKPRVLGLKTWPRIGRDQEWKKGILNHLGWPHQSQADIAHGWKRILASVNTYADLEPSLLGPVEQVIDFLTENS